VCVCVCVCVCVRERERERERDEAFICLSIQNEAILNKKGSNAII
jgi:hypothetical protein